MFASLRKALDWLLGYLKKLGKWSAHNQASSIGAGLAFLWAAVAVYFDITKEVVVIGVLTVLLLTIPLLNEITEFEAETDGQ